MSGGLSDMEELLGRVSAAGIADFLREALACYGAGAHRACIVMTFIAVFEDLRQKTKAIASVNSDAHLISNQIEALASGQKPFENQLVDQLQAKGLITALQAQRLKQIIDHRNKAAHPSGHHASAEEARFVYFEAIDKYLSQPVLSTTHAVDALLGQLGGGNYFPDTSVKNIRGIVSADVAPIHAAAYPYLVSKLVQLAGGADAAAALDARFFLTGLSALASDTVRPVLISQFIKPKCTVSKFGEPIMVTLSADPQLLLMADTTTRTRLNTLLVAVAKSTSESVAVTKLRHPVKLLRGIAAELPDDQIFPAYEPFVDQVIERYWENPALAEAAGPSPGVRKKLLQVYVQHAGSSEFTRANRFASVLPEIDEPLAEAFKGADVLRILAAVCDAAETGAWKAQALRGSRFTTAPKSRDKAAQEIKIKPTASAKIIKDAGLQCSAATFAKTYLTPVEPEDDS